MKESMILIIDELAKKEILRVKEYADANKIDQKRLTDMVLLLEKPVGDNPGYTCILSDVFKIVYSVESQPVGWCRHLSVSVDKEQKLPSVPVVELLMKEFGFTGNINECENIWVERDIATAKGKKGVAINILQLVE